MPSIRQLHSAFARTVVGWFPLAVGHHRLLDALHAPRVTGMQVRELRSFPLAIQYDSASYIGHILHYRGLYEEPIIARLRNHLRPGMNFLDIGGNLGLYTVIAAYLVGPKGRVIAIEPQPDLHDLLLSNCRRNSLANVEAFCCALGATDSTARLYQPFKDNPGGATLRLDRNETAESSYTVRVRTLTDVLADRNLKRIDYVKLDVEGAELEVLEGHGGLFDGPGRPTVLIECVDAHLARFGSSSMELMNWFVRHDYHIDAYRKGWWRRVKPRAGYSADLWCTPRGVETAGDSR